MRKQRRSLAAISRGLLLGSALAVIPQAAQAQGIDPQHFTQIEKGRYLATVGDCAACHTLPGSGHDLAGGRAIETPFGVLVAPNITPDPVTGIGAWTDDEFINALTKGTGRDGQHLFPAMPYTYYTKLTRDDALAIRAYLNAVPAVQNAVKADRLPFPFNIRISMAVWNAMFFKRGEFKPDDGKSEEWNRGAYLAEGPAHCGMCHTPKNFLGGDKTSEALQGYVLQGWFAPDITNDNAHGLGSWSVDDIVAYLRTGHNATGFATGPMSETLNLSTSHMTESDLKAIAAYLKDQPGKNDQATPVAPDQTVMSTGAKVYADECSSCHGSDGKGQAGLFPALGRSSTVQQIDPTSLLRVVLRGARNVGTPSAPTAPAMPAFAWVLKNGDVAAVLTYIRNSWGNAASSVGSGEVEKARQTFAERND
jgi:mono/diheme cytochrome c family protein